MVSQSTNSGLNDEATHQAQEAAQRAEAERQQIDAQRQEEAKKRAQEEADRQAKFIQDRDATASTLKGSTGSSNQDLKGLSSDTVLLRGSTNSNWPALKGSAVTSGKVAVKTKNTCADINDSSVVDACNVPSGLPKSVEKAIASVYADAQPGVSDRVRKGFQAVMAHDWKVAKAWFEDALNHDPENANLKRLAELCDYTVKHYHQGKGEQLPNNSSAPSTSQLPTDADLELLFPRESLPNRPSGISSKKEPEDSDLAMLFPGLNFKTQSDRNMAKKLSDLMLDEAIKMTENDPVLLRVSNRLVSTKVKRQGASGIHN